MGVKFLSEEWIQAVQEALNSNDAFKGAAGSQAAKVQQVVTTPEGEKKYWFKLDGGQAALGMGDSPDPVDATITQVTGSPAVSASGQQLSDSATDFPGSHSSVPCAPTCTSASICCARSQK